MPCECDSDGRVADGSRDEPHDHDGLKLLEVLEVWDVMNVDSATYATDCKHSLIRDYFIYEN